MAVGRGLKPRVLLIVNEASVPVGKFGPTLQAAGLELDPWPIFAEPQRELSGYDAVVALGGTMHPESDEAYAWLAPERALLREAVRRGLPVMGVCLGAQLLSQALGGDWVRRRPLARVGWAPPALTPSAAHDPLGDAWRRPDEVLFWHGVSFTLPPGAELLAGTAQSVEAFRAGLVRVGFPVPPGGRRGAGHHLGRHLSRALGHRAGRPGPGGAPRPARRPVPRRRGGRAVRRARPHALGRRRRGVLGCRSAVRPKFAAR